MFRGDSSAAVVVVVDVVDGVVVDNEIEVEPRFRFRSIFLASMPSMPFDAVGFVGELGVGVVDVLIGVDGTDLAGSSGIRTSCKVSLNSLNSDTAL